MQFGNLLNLIIILNSKITQNSSKLLSVIFVITHVLYVEENSRGTTQIIKIAKIPIEKRKGISIRVIIITIEALPYSLIIFFIYKLDGVCSVVVI